MKRLLIELGVLVLCVVVAIICTRNRTLRNHQPEERVVYDTSFVEKPVHDTAYVVRYERVAVPVERVVHDTVSNEVHDTTYVVLPITTRRYSGEYETYSYEAWVSGYNPSLDSLRVVTQTRYVTSTVYKYPKFNIVPFMSVLVKDDFSVMGGVELPFTMNKLLVVPYGGYVVTSSKYNGWFGGFGVKYNIL